MKAPVAASMRQGNHGPQARSICKKISPQHAQTGKHEYFLKAEIHGRSKPWEFFTEDSKDSAQITLRHPAFRTVALAPSSASAKRPPTAPRWSGLGRSHAFQYLD